MIWRLYCRIGDVHLGEIHADQRPLRGDLIGYSPPEWSPFKGQFHWRVDEVVWQVATPGSVWVRDRIRSGEITDPGSGHVTADIDVLVWPEQGPFWRGDTPGWARWFVEDEVAEHD